MLFALDRENTLWKIGSMFGKETVEPTGDHQRVWNEPLVLLFHDSRQRLGGKVAFQINDHPGALEDEGIDRRIGVNLHRHPPVVGVGRGDSPLCQFAFDNNAAIDVRRLNERQGYERDDRHAENAANHSYIYRLEDSHGDSALKTQNPSGKALRNVVGIHLSCVLSASSRSRFETLTAPLKNSPPSHGGADALVRGRPPGRPFGSG